MEEEKNNIKLIYLEHKYKNMQSLISEMRVMDKSILYSSGAVFALILSAKVSITHSLVYLLPALVAILHYLKIWMLVKEYEKQKCLYIKVYPLIEENENMNDQSTDENKCIFDKNSREPSSFNKYYYFFILVINVGLGFFLYVYPIQTTKNLENSTKINEKSISNKITNSNIKCNLHLR